MSTFGMFTIVLIILYIVYYAIIISRDIYGKKSMQRSEEEEFDVSALQEDEIAVSVGIRKWVLIEYPAYGNGSNKTSVIYAVG